MERACRLQASRGGVGLPTVTAVFVLVGLGLGCGPRVQEPATGTTSTTGDEPESPAGTSESDGGSGVELPPPECEAPEVACGQECVDLQSHHAHCGRCDNYCGGEGAQFGRCHEGRCTSRLTDCIITEEKEEFGSTCAEVCAKFDMECENRDETEIVPYVGAGPCIAGYIYYLDLADSPPEYRGVCRADAGGNYHRAPCDEVIRWDRTLGTTKIQTEIQCCCKQEW